MLADWDDSAAQVNHRDFFGASPLYYLGNERNINTINMLAQKYAGSVDFGYQMLNSGMAYVDYTPIMLRRDASYLASTLYMIEHYADRIDVNAVNNDGDTALTLACEQGALPLIQALLEKSSRTINFSHRNGRGESALDIATRKNDTESVDLIQRAMTNNL
jgi:ankyrin repeat protein